RRPSPSASPRPCAAPAAVVLRCTGSARRGPAAGTPRRRPPSAGRSTPTWPTSGCLPASPGCVRGDASLGPMSRPVVLVAEELAPSALEVLASDFEVRTVDGADRAALLPALAGVDAVIVRSATHIDAEALAAADRLKVVARAGVGLDNVDVPAATTRG